MLRSLRSQYIAASVATFVVMLALLGWNTHRLMQQAMAEHLEEQIQVFAPLLQAAAGPLLVTRDYAALAEVLEPNTRGGGLAFIEVTDSRGRRAAHSGDDQAPGLRTTTLPLLVAGQVVGQLRFGVRTETLQMAGTRLQRETLALGGGVAVAGALGLAFLLTWLTRGFARLSQASRQMAEGDMAVRLQSSRVRELDEVAGAFNRMAEAVQTQFAALRDQQQFLREITDTLTEGFMIVDRDDRVIEANEPFLRLCGLERPGTVHQFDLAGSGTRLLHADGRPCPNDERPTRRALLTGQPQRDVQLQLVRPGFHAWLSINATPLRRSGEAEPYAALAAVTDITRHVEDEQALRSVNERLERRVQERTAELERARDQAEGASRAKSEFLSRMSHELRTPLNAILGFAQLLALGRDRLVAGDLERVRQIEAAGWHLLALINDVLDLSRVEAGAMTTSAEPVELHALLADALALVQAPAAAREVALDLPPAPPEGAWVRADRVRLKQVFVNLLGNAVKYNRRGGRVVVSVGAEQAGRRVVQVADTGRGFEPEQLARLYQPFTRFERDGEFTEGTGIGLVITLRLVELMGGRLEVASTAGEGSCFSVDLPASAPPPAPAGAADVAAPPPPVLRRHRLLYVEDNPSNVLLVRQLLERRPGCELVVAGDGLGGLALARQGGFDLAIVDIDLPGIDGVELCRRLKAEPATAALPLLALSANALPADVNRALAAGFETYITKPLDLARLLGEIDRRLEPGDA